MARSFTNSQFILINIFNFLWLNTKIIQRLPLGAVIKTHHQSGQVNSKCYPLVITPCFPQSM